MDILIKFLADYLIFILIVLVVVLVILDLRGRKRDSRQRKILFIILALCTAFLLAQILHLLPVETLRPYQLPGGTALAEHSNDSPFPSDHTWVAFILAFTALAMTRFHRSALIALVLAVLVAIGRLSAGVHSVLDLLGGLAVALIGAAWYIWYFKSKPDQHKHVDESKPEHQEKK